MPTGYTADVQSGKLTELRDYAMQCARAFGALVTMRDDSSDAAIPERFEPSEYYVSELQKRKDAVAAAYAMTSEEAEAASEADYQQKLAQNRQWIAEKEEQRQRYEAMLAKVGMWSSPTPEHDGLRDFMLRQLKDSINFDCDITYYTDPVRKAPAVWLAELRSQADADLAYISKELAKEIERADSRTRWVNQLRASLAEVQP